MSIIDGKKVSAETLERLTDEVSQIKGNGQTAPGLAVVLIGEGQTPIEINVGSSLKEANDAFRRAFLANTLKTTGGNRTKAAKILDVQRSYLSRLIKELGIN